MKSLFIYLFCIIPCGNRETFNAFKFIVSKKSYMDMENIKSIEKRRGVDIGYHSSNVHPRDGEGCVGKRGLNKLLTLYQIIDIAYKMEEKPNIIIKAGKNAKWYLKKCDTKLIDSAIQTQKWRDTSRCIMYIIEWE